ncbi:facilitated trehalose transporter Tret1-like [Macrosteles quadrilineatus]|uniref:facilitated trehalose transporter Tret1-like n=1 Tax=Macrosteles quadrilineatus TaxID=74068 RepID=UPI0023E2ACEE|nr:facilitated trehalose transporter Tret1-like [Macrosteles quadrilineatus]
MSLLKTRGRPVAEPRTCHRMEDKATGWWSQLVAASSAALCVVVAGSCFGWVTPILLTFLSPESPVPMTSVGASWMISLLEFGNLLTPIPAGFLADTYGRKPLILATGPLYIIGWIIIMNTQTLTVLCVARVLQGLALGIVYTVVPMYLGEIPSPKFRGAVTSIFQSAFYFGFLLEYCIGPFVSYRILNAVSAALPVIFIVCFLRQPETPYFLVMQGKMKEAAKSLAWLRGKQRPEEVMSELESIDECVKREMANQASWKDVVATTADRHALLIVNVVGVVKIMSGSVCIPTYSTQLFARTGFDMVSPDVITIVMGTVIFLSSFFSTALTDITGRRPLLMISAVGCAFSHLAVSIYFFLDERTGIDVRAFNWICPLALVLYCLFLAFGLDPVAMTYRSEMFPANTRAVAASINTLIFTISAFISLKGYQVVADTVGFDVLYLGFSLVCFCGAFWMYYIAIETKGKTLSDIQNELQESAEMRRKQKEIREMDEGVYRSVYI